MTMRASVQDCTRPGLQKEIGPCVCVCACVGAGVCLSVGAVLDAHGVSGPGLTRPPADAVGRSGATTTIVKDTTHYWELCLARTTTVAQLLEMLRAQHRLTGQPPLCERAGAIATPR